MGSSEVTVPITELLVKELNVKGSFRYGVSVEVHGIGMFKINVVFYSREITHCRSRSQPRARLTSSRL